MLTCRPRSPTARAVSWTCFPARFVILLFALIEGDAKAAGAWGDSKGSKAPSSFRPWRTARGQSALIRPVYANPLGIVWLSVPLSYIG